MPPSSNDIVLALLNLGRALDEVTGDVERLDEEAVRARHTFEIALSRAFIEAEGSMDMRKHQAILATADLRLTSELADQKVRAARTKIATLRAQIESRRSLNAATRAEASLASSGAIA